MKKQIARAARKDLQKNGGAFWVIIIIAAVASVIALNPYGHVHHWVLVLIVVAVGALIAAIASSVHQRRRR